MADDFNQNSQQVQMAVDNALNEQKKKKKKKRLIIFGVIIAVIIAIVAASSSGDDTSGSGSQGGEAKSTTAATVTTDKDDSNVAMYKVELKNSRVATDYDGNKVLVVTYSFTNNSDDAVCFDYAVTDKAYQDGIELGTVWTSYGIKDLSFDNKDKDVKPGKSLDVQCAYELNDNKTDVEIEMQLFSIWSDEVYDTFTVKLK